MSKHAAANKVVLVDSEQEKNERTLDKESILKNEPNAMSLAKTKVVYSRRGEEEDTLIVRDLYSGTRFHRFGVKGIAQLERIFYAIIELMYEHRTMLLKRMRYDGDTLLILLDGLSDEDHDGISSAPR